MSKTPKVTVLMPVYNGEKYLREAIESILSQTFSDFEFLIINDGSTDGSVDIIASYDDPRIRLLHNERNLGLVATLNKGLDMARGEFIARMDCDDLSLPERLTKQVAFMDAHPDVGVCGTWARTIGNVKGDVFKYPSDSDKIRSRLLFDSPLAHPSVMIRKSLFERYQLRYDPREPHAEDWGLWQRCSFCFSIRNIDEVLLHYRISPGSISRVNEKAQLETLYRIDSRNLLNLGLNFTSEELQIHRRLGLWQFSTDATFLTRAEQWLTKLQMANVQKRVYSEPAFSQMLGERWLAVCSGAVERGFWAWKKFWQSPLSRAANLDLIKGLKFAAKCAIRWSRFKNA